MLYAYMKVTSRYPASIPGTFFHPQIPGTLAIPIYKHGNHDLLSFKITQILSMHQSTPIGHSYTTYFFLLKASNY